jgi:heme A synthase
LLIALCFVEPVAGAVASAAHAKVGAGGYALAITIGLALGVSCAWTMWTAGRTAAAHIKLQPASRQKRYFRALYFAAMLWVVFALFLGAWASSALMRLVF